MATILARVTTGLIVAGLVGVAPHASPRQAAPENCVSLGTPKPALSFSYRYSDNTTSAEYTNKWEMINATGSRLLTIRTGANAGQNTYVSKHKVVDDVFVLEESVASGTDGGGPFTNSTTYSPGAIGDPAFRACEGKKWTVAAVSASLRTMNGSFSTKTDPGILAIIKINESVTVPAGTFNTVHYVKTMNSGRGQVVDDFWKSIEHGVTVKRNSRQPGGIATEVLTGIK